MSQTPSTWDATTQFPSIDSNTVAVWRINMSLIQSESFAKMRTCLSDREKQRLEKFSHANAAQQYLISRYATRNIIAHYLKCKTTEFDFEYNRYGKPSINAANHTLSRLHFNLSHSGDTILLALSAAAEVGIDVEHDRTRCDVLKLAQRFFHPLEFQQLIQLPKAQQRHGFYDVWTRKEAFVKAIGTGMQLPFNRFQVSLDASPRLLQQDPAWRHVPSQLITVPVSEPYYACVAVLHEHCRIECIDWQPKANSHA